MHSVFRTIAIATFPIPLFAGDLEKSPIEMPATQKSNFRLSGGFGYKSIEGSSFDTGSRSQNAFLPNLANATGTGTNSVGPANQIADRTYTNGFVNQDAGTALNRDTWNWGYQNSSQLQDNNLTFAGGGGTSLRGSSNSSFNNPKSWETDGQGGVPYIQLDWISEVRPNLAIGFSLNWSYLNFSSSQRASSFNASQTSTLRQIDVVDTYDVTGITSPTAPYTGSFDGPGPLINNIPTSRITSDGAIISGQTVNFTNQIQENFEVDLNTISLGPVLEATTGPVRLSLSTGLALNITHWSASHSETLTASNGGGTIRKWNDSDNSTEILTGLYAQGGINIPLKENVSLTGFGRYDWSQNSSNKIGPSTLTIDPTGWTAGVMIGIGF
jgi:hypothetical protein